MVMSEGACLVQSPHQPKHGNGEPGIAGSALRRPRNREVTSRYKSPCAASPSPASVPSKRFPTPNADRLKREHSTESPASASNRRFPTPNVDRAAHAPDVPSPKRAVSVERRRPSPPRTVEHSTSKGSTDTASVPPRRAAVRAELLWPSTRPLTSSMQFEPVLLPPAGQPKKQVENRGKGGNACMDQTLMPSANVASKPANVRRPTPEHKARPLRCQNIDQAENARPQENLHNHDQHRRPGSSNGKMSGAALNRSVDLLADRERPLSKGRERPPGKAAELLVQGKPANGSCSFSRAKSPSINEGPTQKTRSDSRGRRRESPLRPSRGLASPLLSSKGLNKASPPSATSHVALDQVIHPSRLANPARLTEQAVDLANSDIRSIPDTASDTESVSSGGTTATSSSGRGTPGTASVNRIIRGMNVPARFWQDANRSRRPPENKLRSSMPEPEFTSSASARLSIRCKTVESPQGPHAHQNGSGPSSPWSSSMSVRSGSNFLPPQQPSSPMKTSPYRNNASPLRSRGSTLNSGQRTSSAAVMLNFGADVRRGRKGLSLVEEIHLHRILHNRLLQWRFVNARADVALNEQAAGAEKFLYNVCVRIFDLRSSVIRKKIQLHRARQAQKLDALLSHQQSSLDDWSIVQQDHINALEGAVQALQAAVLRVPVTGSVKSDVPAVQDAIGSAFDVMNMIENSVAQLLPKVDKTNMLVSELGYVAAQERVLLEECAALLATVSALEVEERSIRTHLVQCEHERVRVLGHLMDDTASLGAETAVV